ncbi:hypothetical protein UY3_13328 [Chelonia mydas]|uniref:Uncharacterized protein n=1 Tax=Chelonia mydas TaxID=8469 RepID=M7AXS6_CHEMY|nr:hypothetical protein UY3_13328 [Chelonia mydas]
MQNQEKKLFLYLKAATHVPLELLLQFDELEIVMFPVFLLEALQIPEESVSFACNAHDNSAQLCRLHASVIEADSDKSCSGSWESQNSVKIMG